MVKKFEVQFAPLLSTRQAWKQTGVEKKEYHYFISRTGEMPWFCFWKCKCPFPIFSLLNLTRTLSHFLAWVGKTKKGFTRVSILWKRTIATCAITALHSLQIRLDWHRVWGNVRKENSKRKTPENTLNVRCRQDTLWQKKRSDNWKIESHGAIISMIFVCCTHFFVPC